MPVAPSTEPITPRPGTWALRFGIVCVLAALLPVVWQAIDGWREEDRLRSAVTHFFHQLADGRRDEAARHLAPELQRQFLKADQASTDADGGVQVNILSVQQDHDRATVQASIGKQGFALKPTVRLQRDAESEWKIVEILGAEVDPRWTRMQDRERQATDEDLANELAEKLHAGE